MELVSIEATLRTTLLATTYPNCNAACRLQLVFVKVFDNRANTAWGLRVSTRQAAVQQREAHTNRLASWHRHSRYRALSARVFEPVCVWLRQQVC
jgi:hypothetical protein